MKVLHYKQNILNYDDLIYDTFERWYNLDEYYKLEYYVKVYVDRLVDTALSGVEYTFTGKKYSFYDCPNWYKSLEINPNDITRYDIVYNLTVDTY